MLKPDRVARVLQRPRWGQRPPNRAWQFEWPGPVQMLARVVQAVPLLAL